ncbi:MAG TPA: 30S ribosomal protein S1 [Lutibacter sp.]|nr:30S ribosomal protein S1 [Lutibacter sp.]
MSKLQEKIEFYSQEADKLGIKLDADLFGKITKGLGPSIYRKDAEVVSCSQADELATVKKNFLIKKLGLEDSEKLDTAIAEVCEELGKSNKNKYRSLFYYLLVVKFDKASLYEEKKEDKKEAKTTTEKAEKPAVKKVAEKAKPVEVKEEKIEAPVVEETKEVKKEKKEVKAEAPKVEETKEVKEETKEEEVVEAAKEEPKEPKVDPQEFLDNFDWHMYEEGIEEIDEKHLIEFEEALVGTVGFVKEREVIEGTVIRMTEREAIIDINSKSEGVISLNEFRYNPSMKVGDTVEVLVDKQEDSTGQLVLSHRKARVIKAWDRVNNAHDTGEIVTGFVKCRTRGGMIVDIFGIEAFLPGSQIDVKPIRDYDQFVEKNMEFKVVKINQEFKNVVVSHKILIEADLEEQKREIIGQLEKGQVLEGLVKNITSYGVFVDLGGVDGLVHITDLSWSRVSHPNEVVELDEKINVVILDFDEDKSRIQLGIKQLEPHPWEALKEDLKVGDRIKGKVVVIADYGVFVEVSKGVEGLVHVSEMSWSTHLRSASDFVKVGDEIDVEVLTLDREARKMSLGMKQLTQDPWSNIVDKFPVGSTHTGKVRNYTNFGVFVELEEGIDGLVYISDLSWTKKVKHPSDFVNVGDELSVKVIELNTEERKLNLSHKHTTENPWDVYKEKYTVGSKHEGTVKENVDRGAIVIFDENVEAFVPGRHMTKEDGSKIDKGDTIEFLVLEFNKEYRKIVISHTATYKAEEEKAVKAQAKKAKDADPTTLGDVNETLAALKKAMEKGN